MKRIMAFMLALVMVTTCMVSTVFAAEPTPDVSVSFESAAITADSEAIDAANQYALSVFRASKSDYDLGSNGSKAMTALDRVTITTKRTRQKSRLQ